VYVYELQEIDDSGSRAYSNDILGTTPLLSTDPCGASFNTEEEEEGSLEPVHSSDELLTHDDTCLSHLDLSMSLNKEQCVCIARILKYAHKMVVSTLYFLFVLNCLYRYEVLNVPVTLHQMFFGRGCCRYTTKNRMTWK